MKQFLAKWGEGYYREGEKVITMDDITEENGWFDDYIQRIEKADVGEVVDCTDYSGVLTVKRIA
jgi:hypothetical protein